MRRFALVLLSSLALIDHVRAAPIARELLAPSAAQPLHVLAGEKLVLRVRVASGLTPPPGVQSERALRGFAVRLCAGDVPGVSTGGCRAVTVRNVRPVDAHSFVYRVEAPLPATFATGAYDLEFRYPGGEAWLARGVLVGAAPSAGRPALRVTRGPRVRSHAGCAIQAPRPGGPVRGLLLLALSWKLATRRRSRGRRWNSARAPLVTERP